MLLKDKKLNLKYSYHWIRSGKVIDSTLFRIFYRIDGKPELKIAVSVPTAISRKASERNSIRRTYYRYFNRELSRLSVPLALMLVAKKNLKGYDSSDLYKELEQSLINADLIK